jgi:Repeat of unknown function (DUF346)
MENRLRHGALLALVLALCACSTSFVATAGADVVDDDPAAASTGLGNMSIAMRDSAGNLVTRGWSGTQWSPWAALTGMTLSSGPSMDIRPGPITDVFARGPDNAIYHRYYTQANGWSDWGSIGGCAASAPASSWRGNGYLDVVVVGCEHAVWLKNWNASTGWSGWVSLGGTALYHPAIKSYADGSIGVYVIGTDHQLWERVYAGGTWSDWLPLGGNLTSGPSLSTQTESTVDVFAKDANNNIAQRSWNGSSWSNWVSIPTSATSGPAAAAEGVNRVSLFVRGGGDLYTNQYVGSAWSGWSSQFPFYQTSWDYGGADHSVNIDAEANALTPLLSANGGANANSLLDGLAPADRSWLENNYLMPAFVGGPSPSGPRLPTSDEVAPDPSDTTATDASANAACQKEQNFRLGLYNKQGTALAQLRWDVKYCSATDGTINHVSTIFAAPSVSFGWLTHGAMQKGGGWEGGGRHAYRKVLSQVFEFCGGHTAGFNLEGIGFSEGSNGCMSGTLTLDRTVFFDLLWHPNQDDSTAMFNDISDKSLPVGPCSGGSCG